eukprot:gnl/TRDRNA2_/TRDRNA2_42372_c0_seq1.p1 gnl/TRDRNA2_/TRDRNA2_42372_c0~~gnl/TRDRNA2_/TRDRNA2_42372_c0_seq1.p1  ORF type:complete len:473 (+),score=86.22 gnl/TRDRNA2_/TRDRNA2_42372_c0_seq1:43-1419(+)
MDSDDEANEFIADVEDSHTATGTGTHDGTPRDRGHEGGFPPRPGQGRVTVPEAVQKILTYRRWEDGAAGDKQPGAGGYPTAATEGLGLPPDVRPPADDFTSRLKEFSEDVARQRLAYEQGRNQTAGLEVHTFLDLQAYDLDAYVEKKREDPGSLLMIFMFYSRIFEKLVGKQKGVDVQLFSPVDLNARTLSFRGILAWAQDFKVNPEKLGRRELERVFATVHPGPESPRSCFASKISFHQFLDFIIICSEGSEPMDRSRVDGTRVRTQESRLDKVKRFVSFLNLGNPKKVRLDLHNAYRDVHFWKLSDGADFEKEARACEMRSRPQWDVKPVPAERRVDPTRDKAVRQYMQQFIWMPTSRTWEEFEVPVLDMGSAVYGGDTKLFRVLLTNRRLHLARLKLDVVGCGPLRLPWRDTTLTPGKTKEVLIELAPLECGEWCGHVLVSVSWSGAASGVAMFW